VFVVVLHAGAVPGQLVSLKHATQRPVCRLQYGVGEPQLPSPVHAVPPSGTPEEDPPLLLLDELASDPPDDEDDEVVASPPSPPPDEELAVDASSSVLESSPLSAEESVPELELEPELEPEPDGPLDVPELPPAPLELDDPCIDASWEFPIEEVLLPPPHPTATTTATRQPSPAEALKAFIRDFPMCWCTAVAARLAPCESGRPGQRGYAQLNSVRDAAGRGDFFAVGNSRSVRPALTT
jgi:hypothetical protein